MSAMRPLEGIRVIGMEQYMAGPYCTLLLADAGAEVIKIERPGSGDPRRAMPPFAERDGVSKAAGFMGYNRNKKSLALDLKTDPGREVFRRLAENADVVVENLRPGAMDRMGLGYEQLQTINPKLIYAVISGFGRLPGREGPYGKRPAFDIVAEAMSGIMHLVGFEDKPPSWTIYGMADIYSGQVTAHGIMLALFQRERTGRGQFVDSAMYDNMLSLNESLVALHSVAGQSPHRGRPANLFPRGAYQTRNGYIAVNVPDERIWRRVCEVMERPDLIDDPRCKGGAQRARNRDFLDPIISAWFAGQDRDAVVARLNEAGVPVGPVHTAEDIFACPQVAARKILMTVPDPDVGEYRFARTQPVLSEAPDPPARPAPGLGQHSREILTTIAGYNDAQVDTLAKAGVIALGGEN